ncbi:hypothetical protein LX36DRAFT_219592 [Colletotrichum falcatum]|nr:hypothetical protein LX36DRAFT_219592 [Colletotrichum falcatum]
MLRRHVWRLLLVVVELQGRRHSTHSPVQRVSLDWRPLRERLARSLLRWRGRLVPAVAWIELPRAPTGVLGRPNIHTQFITPGGKAERATKTDYMYISDFVPWSPRSPYFLHFLLTPPVLSSRFGFPPNRQQQWIVWPFSRGRPTASLFGLLDKLWWVCTPPAKVEQGLVRWESKAYLEAHGRSGIGALPQYTSYYIALVNRGLESSVTPRRSKYEERFSLSAKDTTATMHKPIIPQPSVSAAQV